MCAGRRGQAYGVLRATCIVLYNNMASYTLRLCIDGYVTLCDEVPREAAADFLDLEALHDEFPLARGDAEWLSCALDQAELKAMRAA